jgi:hypothetical protein
MYARSCINVSNTIFPYLNEQACSTAANFTINTDKSAMPASAPEQKGVPGSALTSSTEAPSTPMKRPVPQLQASTLPSAAESPMLHPTPKEKSVPATASSPTLNIITPASKPTTQRGASPPKSPTLPPTPEQNDVPGNTALPSTQAITNTPGRPALEQRASTLLPASKNAMLPPKQNPVPLVSTLPELPAISLASDTLQLPTQALIKVTASASAMTDAVPFPKMNSTYAIIPATTPFSTKPLPSDQPSVTATSLNPDQRLFKPTPHCEPNIKTLELVIELEDGTINFDNVFPFQHAQDSNLKEFFDFYSTIAGVPIHRLDVLNLSAAFGKQQSFKIQRLGNDFDNERHWQRAKNILSTLFNQAQKSAKQQSDFQILVGME